MKKKSKFKSGYTMVELVVAMSVSAIIVAMLTISIISISKALNKANSVSANHSEFSNLKQCVSNFISDCKSETYEYYSCGESLTYKKNEDIQTLTFSSSTLFKDNEKLLNFEKIKSIAFDLKNNVIYCFVQFADDSKINFLVGA